MYKYKVILILSILSAVLFISKGNAYAVGGRNGECVDADITGYTDVSDNFKYKTQEGNVVEGVCIKAGNDMFGDGHSSKLTENGTYEGCYKISGLGTGKLSIVRISDGSNCKEISHLDFYFSKSNTPEEPKEIDEPEEPEDEEEVTIPEEPEDPAEDHPVGGIVIDEPKEDNTVEYTEQEEDKDEESDDEDEDIFERDEEEYENEVLALSEIQELPKTGLRSWMGSIGAILTAVGYSLKWLEKKRLAS
jgi:hypothetical protein